MAKLKLKLKMRYLPSEAEGVTSTDIVEWLQEADDKQLWRCIEIWEDGQACVRETRAWGRGYRRYRRYLDYFTCVGASESTLVGANGGSIGMTSYKAKKLCARAQG